MQYTDDLSQTLAVSPIQEEEQQRPHPSKKSKTYKQESGKTIWLITYASGSPDITVEMLHTCSVLCDQYFAITWRESKYVLFHLNSKNKMRESALKKVTRTLEETHQIKTSFIVGYDSLTSNDGNEFTIQDHPAFMKMVELINQKNENLKQWLENGDSATNKKSILWKFIAKDPQQMTHKELVQKALEMTPLVQNLKSETEMLKLTLALREDELIKEKTLTRSLYKTIGKRTDECSQLKERLKQAGLCPVWTGASPS